MEPDQDNTAFALRLQAEIQDEIARLRELHGLPSAEHRAKARQQRVQADLVEQGVCAKGISLQS